MTGALKRKHQSRSSFARQFWFPWLAIVPAICLLTVITTALARSTNEFIFDSFNGPPGQDLEDHIGERSAHWSHHPRYDAGITLTNAGTVYNDGRTRVYIVSDEPPGPEYTVEADLIILTNEDHGGIVGRADPDSDTYYAAEGSPGQGTWQLRKRVNGAWQLLSYQNTELKPGRTYRLRLELRDGSQKFYVDGVLVAQAQDSDPALRQPGRAGIRLSADEHHYNDPSRGWQLDNFRVSLPRTSGKAPSQLPPGFSAHQSCDDVIERRSAIGPGIERGLGF